MEDKIVLKVENPKLLAEWLGKFANVCDETIVTIDVANKMFICNAYSLYRDTVKKSSITFEDLTITLDGNVSVDSIDVCIVSIAKLNKKIMAFKDSAISIDIEYQMKSVKEYYTNEDDANKNFGVELKIISPYAMLINKCNDPRTSSKCMTDYHVDVSFQMENGISFNLTPEQLSKIKFLSMLDFSDSDKAIKMFVNKHNKLVIKNKKFEYILDENIGNDSCDIVFDLTLLNRLDSETYSCLFNDNKIKLTSMDSDTCIILCSLDMG